MAIKHDGQGFLVGDPIDAESMASDIAAMRGDIRGIRDAMDKLLAGGVMNGKQKAPDPTALTPQANRVHPRLRDDSVPQAIDVAGRRANARAQRVVDSALRRLSGAGAAQTVTQPQNAAAMPTGTSNQASKVNPSQAVQPIAPTARDSRGRFQRRAVQQPQPLPGTQPQQQGNGSVSGKSESKSKKKDDGGDENVNSAEFRSAADGIAGRIANVVKEAADGVSEADPSVKAMQEIAAPISRGWQLLKGNDNGRRERWYRRILTALVGFRKDESVANKKTDKRLKAIEEKKGAGEEGSGGGMWGLLLAALGGVMALLKNLPVIGPIFKGLEKAVLALRSLPILRLIPGFGRKPTVAPGGVPVAGGPKPPPLPGQNKPGLLRRMWNRVRGIPAEGAKPPPLPGAAVAGAEGAAAEGASAGRLARLAKLGGGAARFAKRIPILGTLLTAGLAVMGSSSIENDDTKTRQEKNKEQGRNWGGAAGGLGGAIAGASAMGSLGLVAGTFLGPGIGNAIGGAIGVTLGAILGGIGGEKLVGSIGEWIGEHWADLTDTLSSAWDEVKAVGLGTWDWIRGGFDTVKTYAMGAFDALKGYVTEKWDKFVGIATSAFNGVRDGLTQLGTWLKSLPIIGPIIKAAEEAARKAAEESARLAKAAAEAAKKKAEETAAGGKQLAKDVKDAAVNRVQQTVAGGRQLAGDVSDAVTSTDAYKAWDSRVQARRAESLGKKHRRKYKFDGISGGESLEKMGSYTQDEANRILELKRSRANTSANVKGGMPKDIQEKIEAYAKAYGLDPEMMKKFAAMESGGNRNAISSTGAIGVYQFTGETASGVGVKDRFDVDQNIEGGMRLAVENAKRLTDKNLPVTDENLYMMHQLGPVAVEVIKAAQEGKAKSQLSAAAQNGMNLNYGKNVVTAKEYVAVNKKALNDRYNSIVNRAGAQSSQPSATPVAAQPASVAVATPKPAQQAAPQSVAPAAPVAVAPPATSVQSPPVAPKAPAPDPAPKVQTTVASTAGNRNGTDSTFGNRDVGQDVRERGIAHIVTGGLASSGIG